MTTGNVIGGYKATLSNPNVSDEAKAHAEEVLQNYEATGEVPEPTHSKSSTTDDSEKNTGNVIGGHKAALKNPNVSEEAKEHSKEVLEELGA